VVIGKQVWMVENLKTTRYNDGDSIPFVTDNAEWIDLLTPGYCWFDNDSASYKKTYGAMYNWYTVNTGKLCPTGWHVPSPAEWDTLITYFGGGAVAGGKMKESLFLHWKSPNIGATNEAGFTAIPGGLRNAYGCEEMGESCYYWTSQNNTYFFITNLGKEAFIWSPWADANCLGISVRCIKD
jgi:uncharacterized protein (TIGR02145 family)